MPWECDSDGNWSDKQDPQEIIQEIRDNSSSDAEFLVNLFATTRLEGNYDPQLRLDIILQYTWSGAYQHFTGDYTDSGFKDIYQDDGDQVGHFLTAVRFGFDSKPGLKEYLFKSAMIGHEMIGDDSFNDRVVNYVQILFGLNPIAHILWNEGSDKSSNLILDMIPSTYEAYGMSKSTLGNSLQDIRLSKVGWDFGEKIKSGYFSDNSQAAEYLRITLMP